VDSSHEVIAGAAADEIACGNCGRRFVGSFCPDCGQEAAEPRQPVLDYLREVLSGFFSLDARAWRTLRQLLARPGFLTVDWFAGRRARYVPPLRLYVFISIVFFAVMAATGGGPLRIAVISSEEGHVLTFGRGMGEVNIGSAEESEASETASGFGGWFENRFARVRERSDDFNAAVFAALSYVHFLLLPIFALVLKPFWRRRYYIEHLVFVMHFQTFVLLIGSVLITAWAVSGGSGPVGRFVGVIWQPALVLYFFLAARRFYGGRWWTTAIKVVLLSWLATMLAVAVIIGVAVATMALF
jgi:hypothetical protein